MSDGGPAQPVTPVTDRMVSAAPALRVAVVSDGRPVLGGPSQPVYVVTDNRPTLGNVPVPVVLASGAQASNVMAGPAIPVVVVSGSLSPINPLAYTNKVLALGPIQYLPFAEPSGTTALDASGNGRNGSYSNVTLAQTGIGDGRTAARFNGTTSFCNIYSASLNGAFTGAEHTLAFWARGATDAVWSDATNRQLARLFVDGNNFVRLIHGADNSLNATYVAGGVNNSTSQTAVGLTGWNHFAFTTSKTANQRKFFINGVQAGITVAVGGTWVGNLNSTECAAGAANITPVEVWNGFMAHMATFASPLSPAQIASLATVAS